MTGKSLADNAFYIHLWRVDRRSESKSATFFTTRNIDKPWKTNCSLFRKKLLIFNHYEVMDTMQYNESQSYGQPYAVRSALVSRLSVSTLSADMGGGRFFTCWIYPNPGNPAFTTLTQDSFYRWKASRPGNVHSIGPPWLPEIILPNKIV